MPGIKARVQMVRLVGQVGYHVTGEHLRRRPRTTLHDVPPSSDALTVEWLTLALCQGTPNAEVIGFEFGPRNDGTSARRTLRVRYNAAGREAGLPEAVFTKSAPSFLSRMVAAGARLAQIEASFYRFVRPEAAAGKNEVVCAGLTERRGTRRPSASSRKGDPPMGGLIGAAHSRRVRTSSTSSSAARRSLRHI